MKRADIHAEKMRELWNIAASLRPNTRPLECLLFGWYCTVMKGTIDAIDYNLTTLEQETLGGKERIVEMLNTPCPKSLLQYNMYSYKRLLEAGVQFSDE